MPGLREKKECLDPELKKIGFTHVANYDYNGSVSAKEVCHLCVYLNEKLNAECSLIAVQSKGKKPLFVNEFSSMLSPYGELCTNNLPDSGFLFPRDQFTVKMPWVTDVAMLYVHHRKHLEILGGNGFFASKLTEDEISKRIVDHVTYQYEFLVQKGRMKKSRDGIYRMSLFGSLCSLFNAFDKVERDLYRVLPKERTVDGRKKYLEKAVRNARRKKDGSWVRPEWRIS